MRYSIDLDINNSKVLSFYVSTFPPTKKEKQPGGAFVTITLPPPHPYPQHTYLDLLTNYFLK